MRGHDDALTGLLRSRTGIRLRDARDSWPRTASGRPRRGMWRYMKRVSSANAKMVAPREGLDANRHVVSATATTCDAEVRARVCARAKFFARTLD